MNDRDELGGLIIDLERKIERCSSGSRNKDDISERSHDVRLPAESLVTHYHCMTVLRGSINTTERARIMALLDRAIDSMPPEADPRCTDRIHDYREVVADLPTTIMEIERDA